MFLVNFFCLLNLFFVCKSEVVFDKANEKTHSTTIGGKPETLITNLAKDILNIGHQTFSSDEVKDYVIGPIWTIFVLYNSSMYRIPRWELSSHCGYWEQQCGDHCSKNTTCKTHNPSGGVFNVLTMAKENWCHQVVETTVLIDYKYKMVPYTNLALTNYGAFLDLTKEKKSPGWTITDASQYFDFMKNAQIQNLKTRTDFLLKNISVTGIHGVLSDSHLAVLTKAPNFTANYSQTNCWENELSYAFHYERYNATQTKKKEDTKEENTKNSIPFIVYTILEGGSKMITDLDGKLILNNQGLKRFTPLKPSFTFFDPCNMQFLALTVSSEQILTILPISGQSQMDFFCIAISQDVNKPHTLSLYEFTSGSKTLLPSNRFAGAISPNYIQNYDLQLTHVVNDENPIPSQQKFYAIFEDKNDDQFVINFKYSKATKCQVTVAVDPAPVILTVTFPKAYQTISQPHYFKELPFALQGSYRCDDDFGTFSIPPKYSKIPGTVFNSTKQEDVLPGTYVSPTPEKELPDLWRRFVRHLEDDLNVLRTVYAIFVLIGICVTIYIVWSCMPKNQKNKYVDDNGNGNDSI